jgi:hypothetical protein
MFKQRLKLHIYKIQIFKCVKSLYATKKKNIHEQQGAEK